MSGAKRALQAHGPAGARADDQGDRHGREKDGGRHLPEGERREQRQGPPRSRPVPRQQRGLDEEQEKQGGGERERAGEQGDAKRREEPAQCRRVEAVLEQGDQGDDDEQRRRQGVEGCAVALGPVCIGLGTRAGNDESRGQPGPNAHPREQEVAQIEHAHHDAEAGHQSQQLLVQRGMLDAVRRRARVAGLSEGRSGGDRHEIGSAAAATGRSASTTAVESQEGGRTGPAPADRRVLSPAS